MDRKKRYDQDNPLFAFRLKKRTRSQLEKLCKGLGYKEPSKFLREFIEVTLSGDLEAINGFFFRISRRAMEQAQAQLPGLLDAPLGKRGGKR